MPISIYSPSEEIKHTEKYLAFQMNENMKISIDVLPLHLNFLSILSNLGGICQPSVSGRPTEDKHVLLMLLVGNKRSKQGSEPNFLPK